MMSAPVRASDLDLIVDKVRRAGALAQHLKSHGLITKYKADGSIVTNADTEVNLWLKEALLDARPALDLQWEHQPTHFWLVAAVGAINAALAWAVGAAARLRKDARLVQ